MKAAQVRRGFSRIAIVAFVSLACASAAYAIIAIWPVARDYAMPPQVRVLVPNGHMLKLPYGLSEIEYKVLLEPYFTSSPPAPPPDTELNPFIESLSKVGAVRIDTAIRDATWPAERVNEVRKHALEELFFAGAIFAAALAAFLTIRLLGWIFEGFSVD